MALVLPELSDEFLERLSVCAMFHADSVTRLQWLTKPLRMQAKYPSGSGLAWIRVLIESEDGVHGHFHAEIWKEVYFQELVPYKTVEIAKLVEQVEKLLGQEADMGISADFCVELDRIAKRGIISTLLGVSTQTCGAELMLTGAKMVVDGDLFSSVNWEYDEEDEVVNAEISADTVRVIDERYLEDAVQLMNQGLACFVLETEESGVQDGVEDTVRPKKFKANA